MKLIMLKGIKMNYIVFDLEFNQGYSSEKENLTNPKCPFELIQIGAVKLNKNLNIISTFDSLIKPEIYTDINPFVKGLTGIEIESLNEASPFKSVFNEFIQFINEDRSILCVWGNADMKELFRNIKYHMLDTSLVPREYINIQRYASKYLNCPRGTNVGLSNAAELFGVPIKNKFHDALNDAYYTAEIFSRIFNKKIKTEIYDPDKQIRSNKQNVRKKKIDIENLFKQFEKMFNREMTEEEKLIIKFAYMMGKTNQFQVSDHITTKD